MDRFVGTWKQTNVDNLEAFLTASGTNEERKAFLRQIVTSGDLYEKIEVSGDDITISEGRSAENHQMKKAKLGHEADFTRRGGSIVKLLIQMEGNKLTENTTGSYNSVLVREVNGNTMTHNLTSNGVTAVRKFTKI